MRSSVLNLFINEVLCSELDAKVKTQAERNIQCLHYLKANSEKIKLSFAKKDVATTYLHPKDFELGLLRDPDSGVGFKIKNHASDVLCVTHLLSVVETVENLLELLPKSDWPAFALKMGVGCIETRLAEAIKWATAKVTFPSIGESKKEEKTSVPAVVLSESILQNFFLKASHLSSKVDGPTHLVFHFDHQAEAEELIGQLNLSSAFSKRSLPIIAEVCSSICANKCFKVSLNPKEYNMVFGQNAYTHFTKDIFSSYSINNQTEARRVFDSLINLKFYFHVFMLNVGSGDIRKFKLLFAHLDDHYAAALLNSMPKALVSKIFSLYSVEEFGAIYQNRSAFLVSQLITQLSTETLDQFALSLGRILPEQLPSVMKKFIGKISSAALDATVLQVFGPTAGFRTFLSYLAFKLPAPVFIALVNKISPETLTNALFKEKDMEVGGFFLTIAARYQTSDAFEVLIQKLSLLKPRVALYNYFSSNQTQLLGFFKALALHQSGLNIHAFIPLLPIRAIETLASQLLVDTSNYEIRSALRAALMKLKDLPSLAIVQGWAANLIVHDFDREELKEEKTVVTADEQKALDIMRSGNALVKIIRCDAGNEKNHEEYVDHLYNVNKRQKVRNPATKGTSNFKFIPLFPKTKSPAIINMEADADFRGHIVRCRTADEQKKHVASKVYRFPIKTPATAISRLLHTGLFGLHDAKREMVGYAFDRRACPPMKALFLQDVGTFHRWWHKPTLGQLVCEANEVQNRINTDVNVFDINLDFQPFVVNEVLAKLNLAALFAILIARDTPKAREVARERRAVHAALPQRKVLPILFYNPEYQSLKAYTKDMQDKDFIQLWESRIANKAATSEPDIIVVKSSLDGAPIKLSQDNFVFIESIIMATKAKALSFSAAAGKIEEIVKNNSKSRPGVTLSSSR